jgi:integrase
VKTCANCGEELPALARSNRRYCGARCRRRAHERRHRPPADPELAPVVPISDGSGLAEAVERATSETRLTGLVAAEAGRGNWPLLFPAARGGYIGLDTWRNREWYPALEAAGIAKRGPYHLRHTFATEALAAGVSIFELARLMGTSVKVIDKTYGHLAHDSEAAIRARLNTRGEQAKPKAEDA